jgi:hypothetical protein
MRTRRWETKIQVLGNVHRHIIVFSTEDADATRNLLEEAIFSGGERMGLRSAVGTIIFVKFMTDQILKEYNCDTLSELATYLERVWMSEEQ